MSENELLCDLHIHTENSDGEMSVQEVVDLYGREGFDVIAVTDHLCDRKYSEEARKRKGHYPGLKKDRLEEYREKIKKGQKRAEERYGMVVLPGIEYTNNTEGYHIVGLFTTEFIEPLSEPEEIIEEIHRNDGIAVACHPADRNSEGRHKGNTYLWDRHEKLIDKFDAWEVANRHQLFTHVGRKELNYLANSDLHSKKHIRSWKTVLKAEKNPESVREAILDPDNSRISRYRG